MESDKVYEDIERFIDGEMLEEEVLLFEKKMAADERLKNLVDKQKAIKLLIVEAGLADIKAMMNKDLRKAPNYSKSNGIIQGGMALVAVFSLYYYIYKRNIPKTEDLKEVVTKTMVTNSQKIVQKDSMPIRRETSYSISTSNQRPEESVVMKEILPKLVSTEINQPSVVQTAPSVLPNQSKTKDVATTTEIKIDPCVGYKPNVLFQTRSSLLNGANGKIICVSNEKGLTFKMQSIEADKSNMFDNLSQGSYSISVTNASGCVWEEKGVVVPSTYCEANVNVTFNIGQDGRFLYPLIDAQKADITIYDKRMSPIANFGNVPEIEWEGRSNSGNLVQTGLYKIEIRYKNGETCFVNLTVFN